MPVCCVFQTRKLVDIKDSVTQLRLATLVSPLARLGRVPRAAGTTKTLLNALVPALLWLQTLRQMPVRREVAVVGRVALAAMRRHRMVRLRVGTAAVAQRITQLSTALATRSGNGTGRPRRSVRGRGV